MTTTRHALTAREVADLLRITPKTLGLIVDGPPIMRRKALAKRRYRIADLERWLHEQTRSSSRRRRRRPLPSSALLTYPEAAEALAVSVDTVRRWKQSGDIPWVQVGGSVRFDPRDIEEHVAR